MEKSLIQKYKFFATGHCPPDAKNPKGIKVKLQGDVSGPPGYPAEVYEAARQAVLKLFPDITFTLTRGSIFTPGVIRYPSLKAVGKPV